MQFHCLELMIVLPHTAQAMLAKHQYTVHQLVQFGSRPLQSTWVQTGLLKNTTQLPAHGSHKLPNCMPIINQQWLI